jgi:hypothetical protein
MAKTRHTATTEGAQKGTAPIYQLKISLQHSRPPIWRRVLVPGRISLTVLHNIIQAVMGWEDYHLHEFVVGDVHYGQPSSEDWYPVRDERKVTLAQIAPAAGAKFAYTYDFGDDWQHTIAVEKLLPLDPEARYPVCIKGKRACPPEDCGGVWGYGDLVQIIQDPEHEEYEEMMEWLGGMFDPEEFDLEETNYALESIRTWLRR